ncbi:MAG: hypothetical protein AAFY41_12575, partial [Bacteroidota bacterium]
MAGFLLVKIDLKDLIMTNPEIESRSLIRFLIAMAICMPFLLFSQEQSDGSNTISDSLTLAKRKAYEATLKSIEENRRRRERDPKRYADSIASVIENKLYRKAQARIEEYLEKDISKLSEIDLTGARLSEIPNWVFDADSLEVLVLDKNRISELPKSLTQLKKLNKIYWKWNDLGNSKIKISKLEGIEKIDLEGNRLKKLPKVHHFENLKELVLEENEFKKIPVWRTRKIKKLIELDISENPILLGKKRWYGMLDNIEVLKLNQCNIDSIQTSCRTMGG